MRLSALPAFFVAFFLVNGTYLNAQTFGKSSNKADTTALNNARWAVWYEDLHTAGVRKEKDSIILNAEAKKIIADTNFRKLIYPPQYTLQGAHLLMQRMENKKGFWYLMNIYTADTSHRVMVLNNLMPFDQIFEMDKVIVYTFYSYALLDPRFSEIKNGVPIVKRPDLLEAEFNKVKELINYILYFRQSREKKK